MTTPIRGVLLSLHDVTPALEAPTRELWRLCRSLGATPALLVVPNWHGEWPLERYPAFMDWVRACARDGAEIILHGQRHDEVGLPRALRDTVRAVGRTNREGEFLTLGVDAARRRIDEGLRTLRDQQLDPRGFIPPAWLAREDTHVAVRMSGFDFSEDIDGVRLHQSAKRLSLPALRWSGRTALRAFGSQAIAQWRWRQRVHSPLLRIALHPQDLAHPITARSVARELQRWIAALPVIRYDSLQ